MVARTRGLWGPAKAVAGLACPLFAAPRPPMCNERGPRRMSKTGVVCTRLAAIVLASATQRQCGAFAIGSGRPAQLPQHDDGTTRRGLSLCPLRGARVGALGRLCGLCIVAAAEGAMMRCRAMDVGGAGGEQTAQTGLAGEG
eukprot:3067651-Prymnesium_polylepis.1